MAQIKIDAQHKIKEMKPLHAGGQPPLGNAYQPNPYLHYITEAGIPYSRLHDVAGAFGGGKYVDIPNIFRDFDADENDASSYDFTFTDILIKSLMDAGIEPYYRLGITIENDACVKAYYTHPPKDYLKWARICEHIIMHYTMGWADGFNYDIRYWEIWNEPESAGHAMWSGTDEEFYEFYAVTATYLKEKFPHIKIGGYGGWGFRGIAPVEGKEVTEQEKYAIRFFEGFFEYIKERNTPIDFYSWHSYAPTKRLVRMDAWLHNRLTELGYGDLETHINEWNSCFREFGTAHHSAEIAAAMIAMQHGHTYMMCIYDMRNSNVPYCPMFNVITKKPIHAYYSMVAFNQLYRLGTQIESVCDTENLYVLAASDGKKNAVIISNLTREVQNIEIIGADLADARYYIIDQERLLSWAPNANTLNPDDVVLIEW